MAAHPCPGEHLLWGRIWVHKGNIRTPLPGWDEKLLGWYPSQNYQNFRPGWAQVWINAALLLRKLKLLSTLCLRVWVAKNALCKESSALVSSSSRCFLLSGCHLNTAGCVLFCSEIRINQELDCEVSRLTFPHMCHILCTNRNSCEWCIWRAWQQDKSQLLSTAVCFLERGFLRQRVNGMERKLISSISR